MLLLISPLKKFFTVTGRVSARLALVANILNVIKNILKSGYRNFANS